MNTSITDFTSAVVESRLLTPVQKREFLDQPELLPEAYRARVITILNTFDERAKARDARVDSLTKEISSKYADT